ncbi:MAG: PQQ-binding-like beta-propeller repeat protein [Streptosporangiales bacterium]|nr:PQQ-binding-like beta-propeller repeat protein [Streptosporangiales bacterium]
MRARAVTGPLLEPGGLPPQLRDGRRLRRVAAALVVLCVGWLAAGSAHDHVTRPTIEVEQRAVDAARALPANGPAAGTFRREWRRHLPLAGELGGETYLAGTHVVVTSPDGLRAYDARTGENGWHYREPGRTLWGLAVTAGAVVVETHGDLGVRLVGLDAATGDRLWTSPDEWRLTHHGDDGSRTMGESADAADGIVAVEPGGEPERLGVDARTGEKRWATRLHRWSGDGCAPVDGSEDARADPDGEVLLAELCDATVLALDAATGDALWSRPLSPTGTEPVTSGGVVVLETGGSRAMNWEDGLPTLLGRNGRRLFRLEPGTSCLPCRPLSAAGRVVLPYDDEHGRSRLAVVDPRDGRVWSGLAAPGGDPAGDPAYVSDSTRLYALRPTLDGTGQLLPAGLSVFDVRANEWHLAPLPYSMLPARAGQPAPRSPALVGAAGGRLFAVATPPRDVPDARLELTSYASTGTREPTELGGVPARDWPDACALLRGIRLEDWESRTDEPDPPLRIGGNTVARPGCGRGETEVRVLWVAATAREADALLDGAASDVGADEEFTAGLLSSRRIVRVGRTIVLVRDYEERESTTRAVVREFRR